MKRKKERRGAPPAAQPKSVSPIDMPVGRQEAVECTNSSPTATGHTAPLYDKASVDVLYGDFQMPTKTLAGGLQ